ncbi:MAG TPA: DUF5666 domain-containing protein, partial [Ktedonobacterales bacterium]|nr:DUF5666 domain-containing protein [Ktedonobacterales bacterium]
MQDQPESYVVEQGPSNQSRGHRLLLIGGIAAALGLALALGVVLGARVLPAYAAGAQNNPLLLASQSGSGGNCGPGMRGALTVSTVSGNTITAKQGDGTTVTVHTTSSTRYERAGKSVDSSQVKSGTQIAARGTRNSDGSIAASVISIILPHADGKITQISGSTITVSNRRGTETIHVSSSTTYDKVTRGSNGPTSSAATLSDLKVGTYIAAEGRQNSDGSIAAEA